MMMIIPMLMLMLMLMRMMITHRMQLWRTTRSAPETSRMKARLDRPRCCVLTMLLRKVLFFRRSGLFCFALPTSFCAPDCHQVSRFALEGKIDQGKEFTIDKGTVKVCSLHSGVSGRY